MNRDGHVEDSGAFFAAENGLAIAALSVMAALPVIEIVARSLHMNGIPGSTVFVQHLTLW